MEILITVALILLALCILVTIHELGHFWAAKSFGIKVETFSIFFPPKLFSFQRGETTYQVGALPLGGYVKIAGMIDESMDTDQLDQPMEDWEFRAKPVWQRFIVMIAGIVMNVILAIVIFSALKFMYGDSYTSISALEKQGIYAPERSVGHQIGFRTGDKFVSLAGEKPRFAEEAISYIVFLEDDAYYEVDRKGSKIKIDVPNNYLDSISHFRKQGRWFLQPATPAEIKLTSVDELRKSGRKIPKDWVSPASKAGLKDGDLIVGIGEAKVTDFKDVPYHLNAIIKGKINQLKKEHEGDEKYKFPDPSELLAGEVIKVTVQRPDTVMEITVTMDDQMVMGIAPTYTPPLDTISYSLPAAIWAATKASFAVVTTQIKGYSKMASGDASFTKNMSGPIAIAVQLKNRFDLGGWAEFWGFTAMISMVLAFINLLPIPALDGGHLMFLTIEAITGREPSDKVKIIAQYIGMIILLTLMIFVFGNDILNLFK